MPEPVDEPPAETAATDATPARPTRPRLRLAPRPVPRPSGDRDGYVRLTPGTAPLEHVHLPTRPRCVVLVDLSCDADQGVATLERLREVTPALLLDVSTLLVRAPFGSDAEQVVHLKTALGRLCADMLLPVANAAVLEVLYGAPAELHWSVPERGDGGKGPERPPAYVRRARAVELHALLTSGRGVWQPTGHHFRVPSGQHSNVFIRLADAFRSERDAVALATWLAPALSPSVGVVADTRGLTPLILGLQVLAARNGQRLGVVTYLEHYPITALETGRAVRDAVGSQKAVLGLLSVSNQGGVLGQLRKALDDEGVPHSVQVLGDRTQSDDDSTVAYAGEATSLGGLAAVDVWLGLSEYGPTVDESGCQTCKDGSRTRLLRVDPGDLGGLALPEPELTSPSTSDALHNAALWEACDRLDAVHMEAAADPAGRNHRAKGRSERMAVKVDVKKLVGDSQFRETVTGLLEEDLDRDQVLAGWIRSPDVIVIPDAEHGWQGAEDLCAAVATVLGAGRATVVPVVPDSENLSEEHRAVIRGAMNVLVLAFGSVSGRNLQRLLVLAQDLKRGSGEYELGGLVLHARPATAREWKTLQNSYGGRLHSVFETLLPSWGPFEEEAVLLSSYDPATGPGRAFVDLRASIAAGGYRSEEHPEYVPVLWGSPNAPEDRCRVRQHSLFGHQIGLKALFAAVGASVHRARENAGGQPGWFAFEMPAICISYYDPLIIACVLRWVQPHEVWWGRRNTDVEHSLRTLVHRATNEDKMILLPELLLAVHEGKVPVGASAVLEEEATTVLNLPEGAAWPADLQTILRVGLNLVAQAGPVHPA